MVFLLLEQNQVWSKPELVLSVHEYSNNLNHYRYDVDEKLWRQADSTKLWNTHMIIRLQFLWWKNTREIYIETDNKNDCEAKTAKI